MSTSAATKQQAFQTDIPARMDRLPWSRWHWLVIISLGITWILDGLEVTIVGAVGSVLTNKSALSLTASQVGLAGSIYILGAVAGSLFFGYLTDRLGRKKLFMITLGLYLLATGATAFSWSFASFAAFRFFTGTGIGGEYAAINSAIDELIPARVRGWTDLAINGSYWIGTIVGSVATIFLLNPHFLPTNIGWRVAFGIGPVLALIILVVRRYVPESPRWLMTHGKLQEANRVVSGIEQEVRGDTGMRELPKPGKPITIQPRGSIGFGTVAKTMFKSYPKRSILGLSLMIGQAFLYNAIFFTYALVLQTFYHVPGDHVGYYLIGFAIGNVLGPYTIGRLFDTIGRRKMITFTYVVSGILLVITGFLFTRGMLSDVTQTIAWAIVFFFASAGASSAYLTVSEVFPLETRSMAIAFFYAVGTGAGGFIGPVLFGALIQTQSRQNVFYGYIIGALLMIGAGLVEAFLGVNAERQSLESVAKPLSAEGAKDDADTPEHQPVKRGASGANNAEQRQGDNAEHDTQHNAEVDAERQGNAAPVIATAGGAADGAADGAEARAKQDGAQATRRFVVEPMAASSGRSDGPSNGPSDGHRGGSAARQSATSGNDEDLDTSIDVHIDVRGHHKQDVRRIEITLTPTKERDEKPGTTPAHESHTASQQGVAS